MAVPESKRDPGRADAVPLAAGNECGTVCGKDGRGERMKERESRRGYRIRRPAPAPAAFKGDDKEQSRKDDAENPERIGSRLAGCIDDACIGRECDARDEAT